MGEDSVNEGGSGFVGLPMVVALVALVAIPLIAIEVRKETATAIAPHEWNLVELRMATTDDLVICVDESRTTSSKVVINWAILVENNRDGRLFGYYVREQIFERVPAGGYPYEMHPPKDCGIRVIREPAVYESLGRMLAKKKKIAT